MELVAKVESLCRVNQACKYLKLKTSSHYYKEQGIQEKQKRLEKRIKVLSDKYPRYGYRRIRGLLIREVYEVSKKTIQKIRGDYGLEVSLKKRKHIRRGQST